MSSSTIRGVRSLLIFTLDLAAIVTIFSGVYYLRLEKFPGYWSIDLWVITATFVSVLLLTGTYFRERDTTLPLLPIQTFFVCLIAGAICILWVYLLGPTKFTEYFGRGILPVGTLLCGSATTLIRFFVNRLYHRQEKANEILYLGYSKGCQAFLKELKNHSEVRSLTIASRLNIQEDSSQIKQIKDDLIGTLKLAKWHTVIIDPAHQQEHNEANELVHLRLAGTPILSLADFYEKYWHMVPVQDIGDDWFLRSQGFSMLGNPVSRRIKRIIDIILSFVLLIPFAPLILLCSLLVKLTSKGPALFKQTRVGLQGKHFTIYKLRTMQHDAEADGAQWAKINDPRITMVGNYLRKSRLDELPQCWNVLKGEMSFVGPRPERPEFTKELSEKIPYYDLRHVVKPGLTGWAQVIFPYGASVDDAMKKLQYELYYIKNQSLVFDLNVMLRTIQIVFKRAGR